jgi:hypothetical protein
MTNVLKTSRIGGEKGRGKGYFFGGSAVAILRRASSKLMSKTRGFSYFLGRGFGDRLPRFLGDDSDAFVIILAGIIGFVLSLFGFGVIIYVVEYLCHLFS